jgi:NADH:ubiquinone oxidoreductase subunit 3 (subunit A)
MSFFTIILIIAMIATLVALVRGIIAFLQTTEAELMSNEAGPSKSSIAQQKAMRNRILFQGIAILLVALLLVMGKSG